jgi:hypothetical protein
VIEKIEILRGEGPGKQSEGKRGFHHQNYSRLELQARDG